VYNYLNYAESGTNWPTAMGIMDGANKVETMLVEAVAPRDCHAWLEENRGYVRPRHECYRGDLSPENIVAAIHDVTRDRCTIVTDVGQHQMWVAKLYPYQRPNTHITSGGLGTMGFAVPAAMGVQLARPHGPVWAI